MLKKILIPTIALMMASGAFAEGDDQVVVVDSGIIQFNCEIPLDLIAIPEINDEDRFNESVVREHNKNVEKYNLDLIRIKNEYEAYHSCVADFLDKSEAAMNQIKLSADKAIDDHSAFLERNNMRPE